MVVKSKATTRGGLEAIIIGIAYNSPEPQLTRELEKLLWAWRAVWFKLLIGCDVTTHHQICGSTYSNEINDYLLQFIKANNLDILNIG